MQLEGESGLESIPFLKRFCAPGLLVCLVLLLGACSPKPPSWIDPLPSPTPGGYSSPDQLFRVYFSATASDDFKGGPDRDLADALDEARYQIDAALYDLNLWTIRNALIRAHERGVSVRVVVEKDSLDRKEIQELVTSGIPVVSDQAESLMHNKFFIIDDAEVWTGSMNMTVNGAYRHLNNLIRVRSRLVAENYTTEFEEMFQEGYFGENVLDNTPHPVLTIDGIQIETYFSPDDSTLTRMLELISEAEETIDFFYYSFTEDQISRALIEQAEKGILVRGVVDAYQEGSGIGGEYNTLREQGVEILLDGHPEKMHHKVMVIDQRIVLIGSYNLTRSAEKFNDENTLIIFNQELAQAYLNELERIYQAAENR
jgi:phosphatidylserine/phosphatidylglycerophosphate/cardiolipin synthase-like enzyme